MTLASVSGWLAALAIASALSVPLGQRARGGRAPLASRSVRMHVTVGLGAALVAFLHPLTALVSLGSAEAVSAGNTGLALGALALLVLLAHAGLGLRLRDPKLRDRPRVRRRHVFTAASIGLATAAHVLALRSGG